MIAIRGSDNIEDYLIDIKSWHDAAMQIDLIQKLPSALAKCFKFYLKAKNFCKNFSSKNINIYLTGHSLGGAIAELLTTTHNLASTTIAFNSPGIANFKGVTTRAANKIYNINSRFDIINKIGSPIGHISYIDIPENEHFAEKLFENFKLNDYKRGAKIIKLAKTQDNYFLKVKDYYQGISQEAKTLTRSISHFNKHNDRMINSCETSDVALNSLPKFLSNTKNHAIEIYCENIEIYKQFANTIDAQHSIRNMLKALRDPKNSFLANYYF